MPLKKTKQMDISLNFTEIKWHLEGTVGKR